MTDNPDSPVSARTPRRFRKKPVVIEAVQWNPDHPDAALDFIGAPELCDLGPSRSLIVFTLEGDMLASNGDWIIRGVKGEFYPCKPDIFEQTYEAVND